MNVFQINPHDNVAVAVDAVAKGSVVTAGGKTFTVCQDIPAGHKVALQPIAKGEDVIKYGFPIGTAKTDIPVGAWVHTQNVQSKLGDLLHYTYEPEKADRSPWKCEKKYEFFAQNKNPLSFFSFLYLLHYRNPHSSFHRFDFATHAFFA